MLLLAFSSCPTPQVALTAALPTSAATTAPPDDVIYGDATWRAAHNLRGYAGAAYLEPEGPLITQVLEAVCSCSVHSAAQPGWVDRLQAFDCLHNDEAKAFYYRHHPDLFVPLLQLTGLPSSAPMSKHDYACPKSRRESCLGCALRAERDAWVKARITRSVADPTLEHDDTLTSQTLPRKVRAFSVTVNPLLSSIPFEFAERLAAVMGVSVQDRPNSRPGFVAASSGTSPNPRFAALWRRAVVPASSALDATIEARPLGRPSPAALAAVSAVPSLRD